MASMLARAAAALPSGRARRLGSGRLDLPGHGHGAGVLALAGRRVGAGRGGVLAVVLNVSRKAWGVNAVGDDGSSDTPSEGCDEEFELVQRLRLRLLRIRMSGMKSRGGDNQVIFADGWSAKPLCMNDQGMFRVYADSAFSLWASVANRLRPPTDSKTYKGLEVCGDAFLLALLRGGWHRVTCQDASDLLDAMERLRRLVSSTLELPLSQDCEALLMVEHSEPEMVLVEIVRRYLLVVTSDIGSMLKIEN